MVGVPLAGTLRPGHGMLFRNERSLLDTRNGDEHANQHYDSRDDIEATGVETYDAGTIGLLVDAAQKPRGQSQTDDVSQDGHASHVTRCHTSCILWYLVWYEALIGGLKNIPSYM